jgi:O-6-methylguanine DNA methyltransferase
MEYTTRISCLLGGITLASDGEAVTGLWFDGQKYDRSTLGGESRFKGDLPIFRQTEEWLEAYFAQRPLPPLPPLAPQGGAFRQAVWAELRKIPFGQTTTYGAITKTLGAGADEPVSARAVGGAVGRNPISILIPCHRVLGGGGNLTGYAGGLDRKIELLSLEGVDVKKLRRPRRGSAL